MSLIITFCNFEGLIILVFASLNQYYYQHCYCEVVNLTTLAFPPGNTHWPHHYYFASQPLTKQFPKTMRNNSETQENNNNNNNNNNNSIVLYHNGR